MQRTPVPPPCIVWLFYTLEYSFLVFLIRHLLLLFFVLFSVREQFILIFVCCCYFYTKMYHFIYECTKKSNLIAHQDNVNNENIYKKMEYLTVLFELDKKKKQRKIMLNCLGRNIRSRKPKQIVDTKIDEPRYKSSTFRIDC